jgi:hypothetical protein
MVMPLPETKVAEIVVGPVTEGAPWQPEVQLYVVPG